MTHYIDLLVETAGRKKEMRFLVSDVGREDVILGYPWLATFEPKFSWAHGTIDVKNLPIVLRSVNPIEERATIARITKEGVDYQLAEECGARGASTDLAIKAHNEQKKTVIPPEYKRFAAVFSDEESQRFPPSWPWDHAIELKPDAPSHLRCKVYLMTRDEDEALDKFIDDQLLKGYIEPSKSPYASPFFFVKKKDGKLRPVQDYRALNSWTVKNQYPLPLIPVLIRDLGGAFIYSKLDVRWGYNNIHIRVGDEWKAAFKTKRGLHQPKVMFFGMSNSPPTFQGFMDNIYYATIAKHKARGTFIRIYMDDIGIATKVPSLQAHINAVSDVLQVVQEHSLYFKPEKCIFHGPQHGILGANTRTYTNKNGPSQGSRCARMAHANNGQGSALLPWILQLLPRFRTGLLGTCPTTQCTDEEGGGVRLDDQRTRGVRRTQTTDHQQSDAGTSSDRRTI